MKAKKLLLMLALVMAMNIVPMTEASAAVMAPTPHSVRQAAPEEPQATELWVVIQYILQMLKNRFIESHSG